MIIGVSNDLSLKYFPYINCSVKAEKGVKSKFLLKCDYLVDSGEDILLTNDLSKADIIYDTRIAENYRTKVLFSANKEDLIEYTSRYDDLFDIYPVDSLKFIPIDFVVDDNYCWVVFTSKRAVDFFFDKINSRFFCFKKIAAVGQKTAEHLAQKGFKMDYVPDEYYGESLVEFLSDKEKVLVVSPLKYNTAFNQLNNVKILPVYENVIADNIRYYKYEGEIDYGLFTSPSAFWHLKEAYGSYNFAKNIKRIVAIGKTTKGYIESCGFQAEMPAKATINSMFEYIKKGV